MRIFILLWALTFSSVVVADERTSPCESYFQPIPLMAQESDNTCGVVCVRSLLQYFLGVRRSERDLANALGVYQYGFAPPENIISMLNAYRLNASVEYNLSLSDLRKIMRNKESAIVSVTLHGVPHLTVLKGMTATHVRLMDPWIARDHHDSIMTNEEFLQDWVTAFRGQIFRGAVIRVSPRPLLPLGDLL